MFYILFFCQVVVPRNYILKGNKYIYIVDFISREYNHRHRTN
jgi:hypothetical protein